MHLLKRNTLPSDIDIHSDLLSVVPSALSRKRALKTGKEKQKEMTDDKGPARCLVCDPNRRHPGSSMMDVILPDRVADFINDFPYLPADQRVIFLWHSDQKFRENCLHRFKLKDLRRMELFWLLTGAIERGNQYRSADEGGVRHAVNFLREAPDLMRMVVGFNLGRLAGQSLPHIHIQYGWEVVLSPRSVSKYELALYFEELERADLVIHNEKNKYLVVAPWTPGGQFALDLYFLDKFQICDMEEADIQVFATVGHAIIKKYLKLGIQNLNIVFTNSPDGKEIEPLAVHFVPRVNMTALYEIKGVNVVDTPPSKIAEEFRRYTGEWEEEIVWSGIFEKARGYSGEQEFSELIKKYAERDEPKKRTRQDNAKIKGGS